MNTAPSIVSELAFLLKLLPLFQEVDTVDRLYRLLLAVVTSGRTVGYRRAILLGPDEQGGVIRGRYGAECARPAGAPEGGFNEMARSVFRNYEQVDASDLTVRARTYAVPFGWHRSAVVKAFRTRYPVLADRGTSEFATDTFFDFFGVTSYLAIPVEVDRRVTAVLAVDRSARDGGSGEEISILYSVVQQAGAAAERLLERSNDRRRARILVKLHDSLERASTPSEFGEVLKTLLSVVCRAVEASACALSIVRERTSIRVDSPDRTGERASEEEIGAVDDLLDRVSGSMESVAGDGSDPKIPDDARDRLSHFLAFPIVASGEVLGALAVYHVKDDERPRLDGFRTEDAVFVETCAAMVASAVRNRRSSERIGRLESFVEEIGSNLVRERERSRVGDKSIEFHERIDDSINRLEKILAGASAAGSADEVGAVVDAMRQASADHWDEVLSDTTSYAMTDLFALVRHAVDGRRHEAEKRGIHLTVRIPQRGAELLLDREGVTDAIEKILDATFASLSRGEKMLVECSHGDGRATVCIADTGDGLPGDAVSRLFMPFVAAKREEGKRSLSLAGNVLRRHAATITVKSSRSWRTILAIGLPCAAGRDRRKLRADRRRRGERRVPERSA